MARTQADKAVSDYLTALNEPDKLKDGDGASKLHEQLAATDDPVARLQLHQQILDADNINPSRYEDAFVTHAKA